MTVADWMGRTARRTGYTASPARRKVFPAEVGAVAGVRGFVADALVGFPRLDDVVLCASEIASNAVTHGSVAGDATVLVIVRHCPHVRAYLAIVDSGGPTAPRLLAAGADTEGRRGLFLVAALCTAGGATGDRHGGHRVWCELAAR